MRNSMFGFILPLLLLTASLLKWSFISLVDLFAFILIMFSTPRSGLYFQRFLLWSIILFSTFVVFSQLIFLILWFTNETFWSTRDTWWLELIGLMRPESWRSPASIYFFVVQLLSLLVGLLEACEFNLHNMPLSSIAFSPCILNLGSHLRVLCCMLLPVVQLVTGISYLSWISLPFFIGSCAGLIYVSLTRNFLGLFRWWKLLQLYASVVIILLYVYQLPVEFSTELRNIAKFIGLYKIYENSDWMKKCSGLSLIIFSVMLSYVHHDLEEMDVLLSMEKSYLSEPLLSLNPSDLVYKSSSGIRTANVLFKGEVFQTFSINFFTYGFPVSLLALSFWSFHFASLCAFGLLSYVGYIIYAFPSFFHLHRLNGLLLVFILLWATGTYIFNVAFMFLRSKLGKYVEIWETIGLWHHPIPGFFLLAQFCLAVLVALGNLVSNSVFIYLNDEVLTSTDNHVVEAENNKVLIVAAVAWGLRKCSRTIVLLLIFLIAMRPGFIHVIYMIFFLIYLLCHNISKNIRRNLILLCECHFAILYIFKLNIISKLLDGKGSLWVKILSQSGLINRVGLCGFLEIALLVCFCSVQDHGLEVLCKLSSIVQHAPYTPIGFSVLKAGLNKSVLLSVYTSHSSNNGRDNSNNETVIKSFLSQIGQKCLSMYQSFGTYIAFLTILFAVYLVRPNYISFGYLFLLLFWISGRQIAEESKRCLWFPLKVYAITTFIFKYCLCLFSILEFGWPKMDTVYPNLGYDPTSSPMENVWESLAIMVVMQLYSYSRRQTMYKMSSEADDSLESGVIGFFKRLLIWHSQKILLVSLFYASLSPISVFGFFYLLGLVTFSVFPKASRLPSQLFLFYTGFFMVVDYLFQICGYQTEIFSGHKYLRLFILMGFRIFKHGFWGIEYGLRGKVLVIVACNIQYNSFNWMEKMPKSFLNSGKWEELCPLFFCIKNTPGEVSSLNHIAINTPNLVSSFNQSGGSGVDLLSSLNSSMNHDHILSQHVDDPSFNDGDYSEEPLFQTLSGGSVDGNKWNKRRIVELRKERFDLQKTTLKVYMKYWMENLFNLFGLEINMIALLLFSFSLLNAISLLYVSFLAVCIVLERRILRKLWPIFISVLASIVIVTYFLFWRHMNTMNKNDGFQSSMNCSDCWESSNAHFDYCINCWLGFMVDDYRQLISYFIVFVLACFKLRADRCCSLAESFTYREVVSQQKNTFVWRDLSFETKSMWTSFDYTRLYFCCHLLDLVLILILITGTLEYDILNLGYLCFALVFFRMRGEILKKKNKVFKFLRIYNFILICLSLAYQSPLVGDFSGGTCNSVNLLYEVLGFYKYDSGFRITSRSALVEIIIYILVSLQSYIFSSREFEHVSRYIEIEQIDAVVLKQEKKAAWKTAQLHHIRESEERKRQRNLQVEKMKSEMFDLQCQLYNTNSSADSRDLSSFPDCGVRRRNNSINSSGTLSMLKKEGIYEEHQGELCSSDSPFPSEFPRTLAVIKTENTPPMESENHSFGSPVCEITEFEENASDDKLSPSNKGHKKETRLVSAVQFINTGVSHVQSIGNQAVSNLANLLNMPSDIHDSGENPPMEDPMQDNDKNCNIFGHSHSMKSDKCKSVPPHATGFQIERISWHIWSQIRSHNDIVCYCCFVLVFLWNFSLLSVVYLVALFFYALCLNTGTSYIFWVVVLIYTEIYILLEYIYQIVIQHCGPHTQSNTLHQFGFPARKMTSSFVISTFPLFLVYMFTLIQSFITEKDGQWFSHTRYGFSQNVVLEKAIISNSRFNTKMRQLLSLAATNWKWVIRNLATYWVSITQGTESPPYFVQLSMDVPLWPEDGIQPVGIESKINELLRIVHAESCENMNLVCPLASRIRVQSIEKSGKDPSVALAVLEVVNSSPFTCSARTEWDTFLTPAADVAKEICDAKNDGIVEEFGFPYPILSVLGGGRREVDMYAYIFGADLMVFFLVAIFYQTVIKNKSQFLEAYQLEDQFPKAFVFILMIIFFLIVLDRIIYLCSFATVKVILYLFNFMFFTYSVMDYAWKMQPLHHHAGLLALRAIYMTKAVSLALQAIQLRYGIPNKSTLYQQFFTRIVSRVNYFGYRIYRSLPFLYELRCVLDWSCTTTSLTMYDWLKMEDIYASLYLVKCDAILNRDQHKQGEKQSKLTKFCNGICLFLILICVIWAPMLMYSSGNPSNIVNPINDASFQVDIRTGSGGRLTLFHTSLCERLKWDDIISDVNLDPHGHLDAYERSDMQLVCCQSDASMFWNVPGVVLNRFIYSLNWDMTISFSWLLNRDRPKGKEVVRFERNVEPSSLPSTSKVQKVLNGSAEGFMISNFFPRYIRVTGSGDVRPIEQEENMVSAYLLLNHENPNWWSFYDINSSDINGCGGLAGPMAIIVSEETPQGFLGETLSKFSIWGLYITFVLAVGRFIRLQCSDLRMKIPYENLPYCDRLIAMCENIYTARAEDELEVEEVLYWTLIKIYRSPHMLLEYTKSD